MKFSINLGAWNSVFAVPTQVVDQHLKLAGGVHLKVLLWLLRHAGTEVDIADISKTLGIGTADIKDAMQYWAAAGLITDFSCDCDHITLTPVAPDSMPSETITTETSVPTQADALEESSHSEIIEHTVSVHTLTQTEDKKMAEKPIKTPPRMKKPDGVYIAQRIAQCAEVGFLMQEAQQILGRAISPALSSTLLMIHDDYGLPVEVIIMLLMYVKSIHKDNTSYIEAVAKNWAEEEINTHEKADVKLNQLSLIAKSWRCIEQVLGINHRSPSAKEEQYTHRWMHEWNFTTDMIREAYERCVNATGKLSLHYMNKILERWHKAGITTPKQAALEAGEKAAKEQEKHKPTYDLEEYEKIDLSEFM